MGILDRFRSKGSLAAVERPWAEGSSIYEHLRRHLDAAGRLTEAGRRLPDESLQEPSKASWAAGALDGVFGHHLPRGENAERVEQLSQALGRLLEKASAASFREVYALTTQDSSLAVLDAVTDALRALPRVKPERVHALAVLLIKEAPRREAVKLGLTLIGIVDADDTELISTLGAHDEFTLFCAVALVNQNRPRVERALWAMAQRVEGWGRIQVVERLHGTRDPEIAGWLLREGFRNSVMDQYLAHTCATAGELHLALAATQLDEPLLRGAAGILRALAMGGPAQDLSDYAHADEAVAAFLEHVQRRPLELELLATLDALSERVELAASLRERVDSLRLTSNARDLIAAGLSCSDEVQFLHAESAASARGIDTFAVHEARVRAGELSLSLPALFGSARADTIDRALDAASAHVPLASTASASAQSQAQLELIVRALQRFPGRGVAFVGAALQSPLSRNRSAAARALAAWDRARWPSFVAAALDRAIHNEPDDELRTKMQRVAGGGPFDEPEDGPRLLH